MKTKKSFITSLLLVTGIIVMINILAARYYTRLDLTGDKRYTLSSSTKDILKNLDQPVTVTAYFSGNLPPVLDRIRREFRDMLSEYQNASKGMLVFEFIDPLKDKQLEAKANKDGVETVDVNVREDDKYTKQKAFMGAVVQYGEQNEVLPLIQSTNGLEYDLTRAIKKLSVKDKPLIGFLQGHGEVPLQSMRDVVLNLDALYQPMDVTLTDTSDELAKYNTLAIIGPTDSIPAYQFKQLDAFMKRGGKLFVAINRVDADLNKSLAGKQITTGLETWLEKYGVNVQNNFAMDMNCQIISYGIPHGQFTEIRQAMFPYMFAAQNFADHTITSGLQQVFFKFASTINFSGDSTLKFTPLVETSKYSGTQPATAYFDIQKDWDKSDFPVSNLTLAAAIKGSFKGGVPTKMVVVGDADFPISPNNKSAQQQKINPDNVNLLVNSIDWLSEETGLVSLRTKGATLRPLDELEEGKRTFLKYLNFSLPLLLIIIYGFFRFQQNRMKALRRREVGHV